MTTGILTEMTIANWCMLAAIFTPYLFTVYAKVHGGFNAGKDNHNPREFLAKLTGPQQRANWAQQNSFEVTPPFLAAVLVAQMVANAEQATIDYIAIAFVISRVLYGICYIADWAPVRTLVWAAGMACTVSLFVISA